MSYCLIDKCRFCDEKLSEVINLGNNFPLAGGFMKTTEEFVSEQTYPLSLGFCSRCYLLQCMQVINSDILFKKNYFYYSSMIPMLVNHFNSYAIRIAQMIENPAANLVVEIGCNDGVLIRPLSKRGFNVIGIDPSDTVKKCIEDGFTIYNTYFNEKLAEEIVKDHRQCDIFLSSNSFAHIDNMKTILNGIKILLKSGGLAIIEVHYSKTIIDELQFDFIYHEHMSYYTVSSFYQIAKLYGFSMENVEFTEIHGKSIRIFLRNQIDLHLPENVSRLIESEVHLTDPVTFINFDKKLTLWKNNFLKTLDDFSGKLIYGYGSSGRTNIICRFIDTKFDEIIDDAPSKIGSYTPIYHQCIKSSDVIKTNPPDLLVILAWPYANDILKKIREIYNGPCLIPLPEIRIV